MPIAADARETYRRNAKDVEIDGGEVPVQKHRPSASAQRISFRRGEAEHFSRPRSNDHCIGHFQWAASFEKWRIGNLRAAEAVPLFPSASLNHDARQDETALDLGKPQF